MPARPSRLRRLLLALSAAAILSASSLHAADGTVRMHDPSTVIRCDGRFYVFSTGRGIPIYSSPDAKTWQTDGKVFETVPDSVHALVPLNDGQLVWAPDVIFHHGEYLLYYSISFWGSNVSAVGLMSNPTLNRQDARYHWTDRGPVVNSVKGENLNAIDPGVLEAPDGTMWLTYGSYIGNVQLVQLDPKTGLRLTPTSPTTILSSRSEASDLIFHHGFYYLFVNRGSCCQHEKSTYNIRVGRSRTVTGPYLDQEGVDMAKDGGTLFLATEGSKIGPGHFGRIDIGGTETFSVHYEADLDHEGKSVLDLRPLHWTQTGWPTPGDNPAATSTPPSPKP